MEIDGIREKVIVDMVKAGECFISEESVWMKAFEFGLEQMNESVRIVNMESGQIGIMDRHETVWPVDARVVIE